MIGGAGEKYNLEFHLKELMEGAAAFSRMFAKMASGNPEGDIAAQAPTMHYFQTGRACS